MTGTGIHAGMTILAKVHCHQDVFSTGFQYSVNFILTVTQLDVGATQAAPHSYRNPSFLN
ncbi:MAG: hypothetical protein Q7T40_00095 [Methylobacter sp.]|nr:hypothetical protein [Methylobacter sp.]